MYFPQAHPQPTTTQTGVASEYAVYMILCVFSWPHFIYFIYFIFKLFTYFSEEMKEKIAVTSPEMQKFTFYHWLFFFF